MSTIYDRFQGDPKLFLSPDGSTLDFEGGQPKLDAGIENLINISLFTEEGWWGNSLYPQDNQIGSNFEQLSRQPITLQSLRDVESAAEAALKSDVFGEVSAVTTNPNSQRLDTTVAIRPPSSDIETLTLSTYGQTWFSQAKQGDY